MKRLAALALLLLATACSPLQQCLYDAGREVKRLERLAEEARGNIERGYAIHRQTVAVPFVGVCPDQNGNPVPCQQVEYEEIETPVAINIAEERRKLAELERRLVQARRQSEAAIAQCHAQHPEG
jgi:hypothetical protein